MTGISGQSPSEDSYYFYQHPDHQDANSVGPAPLKKPYAFHLPEHRCEALMAPRGSRYGTILDLALQNHIWCGFLDTYDSVMVRQTGPGGVEVRHDHSFKLTESRKLCSLAYFCRAAIGPPCKGVIEQDSREIVAE